MPAEKPRWAAAAWLGATAAAAATWPAALLAGGFTLSWRDSARLFAPVRRLVAQELGAGRLPLWNPFEGLGAPLLAQWLHGPLHPFSVAAALLAPGGGVDGLLLAHQVAAALGAAVLARTLGASPPAAAVAGLGYGLSGWVLGMTSNLQYLAAASASPWALAGLRIAGQRGASGVAVAALAFATSLLAGDPQTSAVVAVLGLLLAWDAAGAAGMARGLAGLALGAAIAAVQLLPSLAYFGATERSLGLAAEDRGQWSLSAWRMVELVAPGFFGGPPGVSTAPVFQLLGGPSQYPIPFAPSVHVGAPLLALAWRGASATRTSRLLAGAAILLLWASLGPAAGASLVLDRIPLWGAFRYAEKLVGPMTLCLALLAAKGADRGTPGPILPRVAAGGAVLAGAAAALLPGGLASAAGSVVWTRLGEGLGRTALSLAALAAAGAAARAWPARLPFPALAAGFVLLQSLAGASFALHAGQRDAPAAAPLAELRSGAAGPVRVAVATTKFLSVGPSRFDDWDRYVAVHSRMGEPSHTVASGVDSIALYSGLTPARHADLERMLLREFGPARLVAWRRFGLTHVVVNDVALEDAGQAALAGAATEGGTLVTRDPAWRFAVWRVPARSWAFFARSTVEASPADARAKVADLLEARSDAVVVEGSARPGGGAGRVISARRGIADLRIEADAEADGLLVVNEAFAPGWRATIDGAPVAILAADALVRAVPWPAGRHVLEMRYDPPEVRAGMAVSAVALAVVLGLLLVPSARALAGRANRPIASPPLRR